VKDNHKKCQHD